MIFTARKEQDFVFCKEGAEGAILSCPFCLPSGLGNPDQLKETDVIQTKGKTIRIARALLVTVGSEGSDRKEVSCTQCKRDTKVNLTLLG